MTRRELLHRHLTEHPGLTAHELARALRLPSPPVSTLRAMAADGEAECTEVPRGPGDRRVSRKWRAT